MLICCFQELVKYQQILKEPTKDCERALDFMYGVPTKANDLKFINSIEGYKGSIQKLGRLLAHVSTSSQPPELQIALQISHTAIHRSGSPSPTRKTAPKRGTVSSSSVVFSSARSSESQTTAPSSFSRTSTR